MSANADLAAADPHVLREYALLADGERGILVGPRGDFAWMCFPRWNDDAMFSSLIGGNGSYAITPAERCVWGGYYEEGSLIWHSRWITNDSIIECREALALPSRRDRAVVLRRVTAIRGPASMRVSLNLRGGFGEEPARRLKRDDAGIWRGLVGTTRIAWLGGADASPHPDGHNGKALTLSLTLPPGHSHDFVLVLGDGTEDLDPPDPEWVWQGTSAAWADRVPRLHDTVAQRDARHAYAVMHGLTSSSGGMVAAATTSLPERASQGRNYDYRYAWIRDQCYAGQAAAAAGGHPLMDTAVAFARDRLLADGERLKPAYTVSGGYVPDERPLALPGYPGGTNIVGNWVNQQFQLDGFGESLLLFAAAARHDHLDADAWRAAEAAAEAIAARWHELDAGIWEITPKAWTHSRLICAAGLRAISHHSPGDEQAARWASLADRIVADTATHAVHRSGHWQRAADDPNLDAALLLPALRGAIPADDPRSVATLHAIDDQLTEDGYVYRYRPDERPLGNAEGAFLVCGFWMALAWAQQGEHTAAARWFERNRAACGPPGLLAEEFDVTQRQLRGNLPQAFVHALLLECAAAQHTQSSDEGFAEQ
jgi:GH15 family glucan-1,4-alpha-glucosidase